MTFTVTYRGKDGTLREETVEAAGRAECFAQCKARGITPRSVREGRSGNMKRRDAASPGESGTRSPSAPPGGRAMLATAVVLLAVLLVGIALWWFGGREASAQPARAKNPEAQGCVPPDEKPKAARVDGRKRVPPTEKPRTNAPNPNARERVPPVQPSGTILSVRTNDNNLVITEVMGSDGKRRYLTTELHKPVFSNPADQLIAAAMSMSMGSQMAPLPLGPESDWQFKAAMKRPIPDDPDDTEEVKRMKQVVRETRQEIARLMEQGQTFADILEQHRELWNENVRIRDGVVAEYRKIVRGGDEEEAKRYLNKMNATLGQMGIPPLTESDGHSKRRRKGKTDEQDEH